MKELSPYWWYQLKWYEHWVLYLHPNQYPYLGRCYAATIREDADDFSDILPEELAEFSSVIIPAWTRANQQVNGEDFWLDLAIFGNDWAHAHAHFIPRYYSTVTLSGVEFLDPNPGKSYSPYPKKSIPQIILLEMKLRFLQALY